MDILTVCFVLIVVGFLLWLVNAKFPTMDGTVKIILNFVVIIALVFWLLRVFGFSTGGNLHVGNGRNSGCSIGR